MFVLRALVSAGLLSCVAAPAAADGLLCSQLSNLVSRPTVATTACAIGDGSSMVEAGYTNQSAPGGAGTETRLFPQTTVRDGLGHGLEFVLTPPSYERVSTMPALSGDADGMLGVKYQFASTSRFASAVSGSYVLSTGTPGLETSGEGVELAVDDDYALSPAVGISSTLAYVSFAPGAAAPLAGRTAAIEPALGVSVALPANFNVFAEGFGKTEGAPHGSGQYGIDGGVSYDAGARLQIDANVYDTIGTSGGRSHALGFGAAYLFGKAP